MDAEIRREETHCTNVRGEVRADFEFYDRPVGDAGSDGDSFSGFAALLSEATQSFTVESDSRDCCHSYSKHVVPHDAAFV